MKCLFITHLTTRMVYSLTMIGFMTLMLSCENSEGQVKRPDLQEDEPASWLLKESVKVAACQIVPGQGEMERMLAYIDKAAAEGVDLVVFPEYAAGPFSIPVKATDPVSAIVEAAKQHQLYVIIGGWEEMVAGAVANRIPNGFANTALLIGRDGTIVGKYRKVHPAVGEPPHWWPALPDQLEGIMQPGDTFPVFTTDFGCIGIMTCYDGYFPESAHILSLHGAELVVWINGREGAIEQHLVLSDVQRNYVAMVATNHGWGAGTLIAQSAAGMDAYVTETGNHYVSATINLRHLRNARANSRVHHQRRPDLYHPITQKWEIWKVYEQLNH